MHRLLKDAQQIAYQGHPGAYSHLACTHVFPTGESRPYPSFVEAMQAAESGDCELAMIPLENSSAGRVEEIYRLIPRMSLHILGEHFEPVSHCLLGLPGSRIDELSVVASHPQALAQCFNHLQDLGIATEATLDTAGAALAVSKGGDPKRGAIASRLAAEMYGLEILRENLQDEAGNTTRFIILSRTRSLPAQDPGIAYITSVLFRVRNIPAALYKSLGGFATNGVNLVKLESYTPGGNLNASQFHVDIEGHAEDPRLRLALGELGFFAEDVRLLGTYPAHPFRSSRGFRD